VDLQHVRDLLRRGEIELDLSLPHALTEARKDGLTTDDLEAAVMAGEMVEDYGDRVLLLHSLPEYQIPYHIVLEYAPGDDVATVVTLISLIAVCGKPIGRLENEPKVKINDEETMQR
jgi:hypothetical protein